MIDWQVVAAIAAPIVALFFGVWVNRRFESRPILVSYYGHVSAFTHHPAQGQPINVHTHAIVLRNAGRRTATNVRIGHNVLPDFNIWPQLNYSVGSLPGGGQEIIIPTLVPVKSRRLIPLFPAPDGCWDQRGDQVRPGLCTPHHRAAATPKPQMVQCFGGGSHVNRTSGGSLPRISHPDMGSAVTSNPRMQPTNAFCGGRNGCRVLQSHIKSLAAKDRSHLVESAAHLASVSARFDLMLVRASLIS